MDKYLRPERLDIDANDQDAAKKWLHWRKTFDNFLSVALADDKQKLLLLCNFVSANVFAYISECTTFTAAIEYLEKLYVKPKNEIFARHILATRKQKPGESLDDYMQELKQLSADCNFKDATAAEYRNNSIRDAFITGLASNQIRQRLLENDTLTLDLAFNQARSLEMAQKQSASYSGFDDSFTAAQTKADLTNSFETAEAGNKGQLCATNIAKCYFCGQRRHSRNQCPAKDAICRKCNKTGHFAKVCRSSTTAVMPTLAVISAAAPSSLNKTVIPVYVNDTKVDGLVDSGSTDSFVSGLVVNRLNIKTFNSQKVVGMASSSLKTTITRRVAVDLVINDHSYTNQTLFVVDDLCADVIIGHDILEQHKTVNLFLGGSKESLNVCALSTASVPPVSIFSSLDKSQKPIASKSRRYTKPEQDFIKQEVDKLLKEAVIEPSISPWRAQVLVATGSSGKRRLVVDYSCTVNRYTSLDAYPLPRIDDIVQQVAQYSVFSTIDLRSAYHQIPILESEKLFTAFEANGRLYQFRRIPFGVTNGVASFQRAIESIISAEQLDKTFAYLDDVTICGVDQADHDKNLQRFMETAKKYRLQLNEEKCRFGLKSVTLLGYEISNRTIAPDPNRLKPLLELPIPHDLKSLRRALGMFAHYAKWIPQFSTQIGPLVQDKEFPLSQESIEAFERLKGRIASATLDAVDESSSFTVETDASDFAIGATLCQGDRPVAFFSRTLSPTEKKHSSVEKEAYAIVESLRHWRHYLIGRSFKLLTDQRSVAFMFDRTHCSKVKNDKIVRWRVELSNYHYDIVYRPGRLNEAADALSRSCTMNSQQLSLKQLHASLCHPGVSRLAHFVRSRNLPYSVDEVRNVTRNCRACAEIKPQFIRHTGSLIKATQPFERLSLDFKGPLPASTSNRYLLTIVDEYSRFPFAFPCRDMTTPTVITCLSGLFSIFGLPAYVHSDRGPSFMTDNLRDYLVSKGVCTSRTSPYNPRGNGQVERFNGIIWKAILLALKSKGMPNTMWEVVLPDALHSIRSLLCTATNSTPHERLFSYARRTQTGRALPSWLFNPGPVYLKRHVRNSKYDPIVDEVELIEANPEYAHVRFPNGRESTVSLRDLAPLPSSTPIKQPTFANETNGQSFNSNDLLQNNNTSSLDQDTLPAVDLLPDLPNLPPNNERVESQPVLAERPRRTCLRPAKLNDYYLS